MASAGQIFNEQVFTVSSDVAGVKTLNVVLDNEGCIITVQKISGVASVAVEVLSNLPDPMTFIRHQNIVVKNSSPKQYAYIPSRVLKLDITYTNAMEAMIVVRSVSAAAALIASVVAEDVDDTFETEVLTCMSNISEHLEAIRNHQRQISGIERDKGETF